MNETKFTPGPWRFSGYKVYAKDFGVEEVVISETLHYPMLVVSLPTKDAINYIETVKANAKLIAAAPDMFEIIKELYDWAQDTQTFGPIYPKLEAAYKKATT